MKMDKEYIMRTEIKFNGGKFVGLVNGKAVIKSTSKGLALEFLKSNLGKIPNMSLRSLIAVTKIANTGNREWKDLAKYVLTQGN